MSTPNFYNKNASKIFASECKEEWDFDDLLENVRSELKGARELDESDGDRNYPATIFTEFDIRQGNWIATINLTARSGYYGGVNLDWEAEIENEKEYGSYELGEIKIPASLQARIDSKVRQVEKVYKIYTTPLICRGVFSNGEAVYEKAKN